MPDPMRLFRALGTPGRRHIDEHSPGCMAGMPWSVAANVCLRCRSQSPGGALKSEEASRTYRLTPAEGC